MKPVAQVAINFEWIYGPTHVQRDRQLPLYSENLQFFYQITRYCYNDHQMGAQIASAKLRRNKMNGVYPFKVRTSGGSPVCSIDGWNAPFYHNELIHPFVPICLHANSVAGMGASHIDWIFRSLFGAIDLVVSGQASQQVNIIYQTVDIDWYYRFPVGVSRHEAAKLGEYCPIALFASLRIGTAVNELALFTVNWSTRPYGRVLCSSAPILLAFNANFKALQHPS